MYILVEEDTWNMEIGNGQWESSYPLALVRACCAFSPSIMLSIPPIINLHAQNHQSHIISHVSFPTGQAYFKKTIIYRSFPPTKMRILLCLLLLLISCTTA